MSSLPVLHLQDTESSPVVEVYCCEMSMGGEDAAWGRRVLKVPQIGVRARLDYKEKD